MPLKGFRASVFWWHEQGSFCPLSNLSYFQGQPRYLELVIQYKGRSISFRYTLPGYCSCWTASMRILSFCRCLTPLRVYIAPSLYICLFIYLYSYVIHWTGSQPKTRQTTENPGYSYLAWPGIQNCKQSKRGHVYTLVSVGGYWWLKIGYFPSNNINVYYNWINQLSNTTIWWLDICC